MEISLQETAKTVWNKSKWLVKGMIIGFLTLIMLIPMAYVKELVLERQDRQKEAAREITGKWAGAQNIAGPVIGVPFWKYNGVDAQNRRQLTKHVAYFLPDELIVDAKVNPKEKHRGIFKVMLYDTKIHVRGSFAGLAFDKLNTTVDSILWNEAFVIMNISDSKGLNDPIKLSWNGSSIELSPRAGVGTDEMTALLKATAAEDFQNIKFSTTMDLNGSEQLLFTPVGKATTISMNSTWKDPSFSGSLLPQTSVVSDSGFTATWKSPSHKRNFPQQWIDNAFRFDNSFLPPIPAESSTTARDVAIANAPAGIPASAFGVNLFIPVNGYQKTLRTVKYAMLCIVLTFAAFFLVETAHKKSVHPFQYGLVGLALILFYTLLLSFSEYTGFNAAYMIATVATVGLIGWFIKSVLQSGRASTILTVVLVLIYSYVFSLLQLQDYSLLLGSIGLFLSLAVVMYFSRKLKW